MKEFYFSLNLDYEECLAYYKGHYNEIQVVDDSGKKLRFSAQKLTPFVSSIGIKGRFRLKTNDQHQFMSLEKII